MAAQAAKGHVEPTPPPTAELTQIPPAMPAQRRIALAEIRQLLALMDASDLIEITLTDANNGVLVSLRKTTEAATSPSLTPATSSSPTLSLPAPAPPATVTAIEPLNVTAPLVGMWFPAMRAGHKPLVAVGDEVREGQIIGAIETLRVMNEVESSVAGRVRTIIVKPGQAVEYGQVLIELDQLGQ